MAIQLDQETQRLIENEVEAGRFSDAAAFVSAAVRHFLVTREDLGYSRDEIDEMISEAIAAIERGEGADGEESVAALEKKEAERQRRGS